MAWSDREKERGEELYIVAARVGGLGELEWSTRLFSIGIDYAEARWSGRFDARESSHAVEATVQEPYYHRQQLTHALYVTGLRRVSSIGFTNCTTTED